MLTCSTESLNASKGDNDAHDLETAETSLFRDNLTDHGLCWWAAQTVRVKSKYQLSADLDEKSSLQSILESKYQLSADLDEKSSLQSILDSCTDPQVYRPRLAEGSDWVFRSEFLGTLSGEREIAPCQETITDVSRLSTAAMVVSPQLSSVACVSVISSDDEGGDGESETTTVETPLTEPVVIDPRAAQKAAQTACIQTLESRDLNKTCGNIRTSCPDVDPIRRGEPLYGSLRDSDNDGVVCESL